MARITRYQGAIIRDHHLLLIKQTEHASGRSYWLLPGGGLEFGETLEQGLVRELQEEAGLTVTCDIDHSLYPKGIKVTDAEMTTLNIQRHTFQDDWNYTISPRQHGPP